MATTGLDSYIADTKFRSRNPLFKTSETYHTEQEKRRLKRSKGKPRLFSCESFHFAPITNTCICPAGKTLWRQSTSIITQGKSYSRFTGYLKDCRVCPLQNQCMRKQPKSVGRQVQFLTDNVQNISHSDRMKIKIDSPIGRRQYSKRLGAIEPVFGNITINKGMNKFTLRGQDKVNTQWQMYCLVHNIEKLRNHLH